MSTTLRVSVAAVLMLALAACGGDAPTTTPAPDTSAPVNQAEPAPADTTAP